MTPKVTREEIEKLCILHAVGTRACAPRELAERLGLSPALAGAVVESLGSLRAAGWVVTVDDLVVRTPAGTAWLAQRLAELGVR